MSERMFEHSKKKENGKQHITKVEFFNKTVKGSWFQVRQKGGDDKSGKQHVGTDVFMELGSFDDSTHTETWKSHEPCISIDEHIEFSA